MKISELEQYLAVIREDIGDKDVAMVTNTVDNLYYRIEFEWLVTAMNIPINDKGDTKDICALIWEECYGDSEDNEDNEDNQDSDEDEVEYHDNVRVLKDDL